MHTTKSTYALLVTSADRRRNALETIICATLIVTAVVAFAQAALQPITFT